MTIVISIAAYFAQKWIQTVDDSLKDNTNSIKAHTKTLATLEAKQGEQSGKIFSALKLHFEGHKIPLEKLDEIAEETEKLQILIRQKILPELSDQNETLGKVIVLETKFGEQNRKLITLYTAVKALAERLQPKNQK